MEGNATPLRLPNRVRKGEPVTADWANSIRNALDTLNRRANLKPNNFNIWLHPFKIFVSHELNASVYEYRMRMIKGNVSVIKLENSPSEMVVEEVATSYNTTEGKLLMDEFEDPEAAEGYTTLSNNTSYGVWCCVDTNSDQESKPNATGTGEYTKVVDIYGTGGDIVVDTTYRESTDALAKSQAVGKMCFYIGFIETSSGGFSTIKQYRRSDIVIPNVTLMGPITSTTTSNDIGVDPEGGVYFRMPPIVSGDAGNDISQGTDGGAYYDAP